MTEQDPFAAAAVVNTPDEIVDPFASTDDAKGSTGPFIPWPKVNVLADRLVILLPKSFDGLAPSSKYAQEKFSAPATRPEWRCDLVILDGPAPITYEHDSKVEGTEDRWETKEFTIEELPFLVPHFRITWANVVGTLNKLNRNKPGGAPLIGRLRAGYSAKEMRGGKTFADFAAEVSAWAEKARRDPMNAGNAPRPTWHFEVAPDVGQEKDLAMTWYRVAAADGYRITPPTIKNAEEGK